MTCKLPVESFFQPASNVITKEDGARWILEDLVPSSAIGELIGPSGIGKTFLALRMMANVARSGKKALLVTKEMALIDWKRRTSALSQELGADAVDNIDWFDVGLFERETRGRLLITARKLDNSESSTWEAFVEVLATRYKDTTLGLVFFDTFSLFYAGEDENSAKPTSEFFATLRSLPRQLGCSVIVLHHTAKNKGNEARGSNVHTTDVDFSFVMKQAEEKSSKPVLVLESTKSKESETGRKWQVVLKQIGFNLVREDDGKKVTESSLVAEMSPIQEI